VSHEFKKRLLFDVVLDFAFKHFNVLCLGLNSVLVNLTLKLHAWKHLLGVYLKVL